MTVYEVVKQATNSKIAREIKNNVAKHNVDNNTGKECKKDFNNITDCIAKGFVWDQTPEGFDYWAEKFVFYNTFLKIKYVI